MLKWSELDPARFERAVQQLLKAQFPDLVSIDGAGGDDGRDAQLKTSDGLTVFEVKGFNRRVAASQRRQIERSVKTAIAKVESMTRWVLVVPLNQTPSELEWFRGKLADLAPGVELEWCGIDWLDNQATVNEAFRRYIEGTNSQLLKAASELGFERAILANGAGDLFNRNASLRERVDAISMHWTLDWAVQGHTQSFTVRAKHPQADKIDPIRFTPRFTFDTEDRDAIAIKEQYEDVVGYGGKIELDDKYMTGLDIDASDEARLLLAGLEGPGTFVLQANVTTFARPIRSTIEIQGDEQAAESVRTDVWFRTRTSGAQGIHLHGGDAAGAITVDLRVPHPVPDGTATIRDGAGFNISFDNPWNHAAADIISALRLHTAMRAGGDLRIRVHGLVLCMTAVPEDNDAVDYSLLLRIAEVVHRLEQRLGLELRLPDGASKQELEMAEAALDALDDEPVELPFDTFTATIVPGRATSFVDQLPEEPFALFSAHPDFVLTLGDLDIPYGPLAMSLPQIVLSNREELLGAPPTDEPVAKFKTAGKPMYFTGRSKAEEHARQLRSENPNPDEAA